MSNINFTVLEKPLLRIQGGVDYKRPCPKKPNGSTYTGGELTFEPRGFTIFNKKDLMDLFKILYNEPNTPLIDTAVFDMTHVTGEQILPPYIYDHRTWLEREPPGGNHIPPQGLVVEKDLQNFTPITFQYTDYKRGLEGLVQSPDAYNACIYGQSSTKGLQIKVKFGNKNLNIYSKQVLLTLDCNCIARPA